VNRVQLALKVHKALLVQLVQQDHKVLKENRVHRVLKVQQDLVEDLMELMDIV
jgi:hypothetical protein